MKHEWTLLGQHPAHAARALERKFCCRLLNRLGKSGVQNLMSVTRRFHRKMWVERQIEGSKGKRAGRATNPASGNGWCGV